MKSYGLRFRFSEKRNLSSGLSSVQLPDDSKDATDDILEFSYACMHVGLCGHQCTSAYRIHPEELAYYREQGLPLPRLCPNCRHYERLARRNPPRLWRRQCLCSDSKNSLQAGYENVSLHDHGSTVCTRQFLSAFAPDRQELVYCEECFQAETA